MITRALCLVATQLYGLNLETEQQNKWFVLSLNEARTDRDRSI